MVTLCITELNATLSSQTRSGNATRKLLDPSMASTVAASSNRGGGVSSTMLPTYSFSPTVNYKHSINYLAHNDLNNTATSYLPIDDNSATSTILKDFEILNPQIRITDDEMAAGLSNGGQTTPAVLASPFIRVPHKETVPITLSTTVEPPIQYSANPTPNFLTTFVRMWE